MGTCNQKKCLSQQLQLFSDDFPIGLFAGTKNPRYLRVLGALLLRPLMREEVDAIGGCSNGPELMKKLQRKGLAFACNRLEKIDRDGLLCWPGEYALTANDRRLILNWLQRTGRSLESLTAH